MSAQVSSKIECEMAKIQKQEHLDMEGTWNRISWNQYEERRDDPSNPKTHEWETNSQKQNQHYMPNWTKGSGEIAEMQKNDGCLRNARDES